MDFLTIISLLRNEAKLFIFYHFFMEKAKSWMYGEMPIVTIGNYDICMMSDREWENRVWIQDNSKDGWEAWEFLAISLEPHIKEFFDKSF